MVFTHWLRLVLMRIIDKEFYSNLIMLKMYDYYLILDMDFLGKFNAFIEYRRRKVVFDPEGDAQFEFIGYTKKKTKLFMSTKKAQKMLVNGCTSFLAMKEGDILKLKM